MSRSLGWALCCGVWLLAHAAVAQDKPYVIGLEPTLAEAISLPEGRILAKYLSTALKHPVESKAFTSYDDLVEALAQGEVDFAWINPLAFVKASQKSPVIPIAKVLRHGESYRSVLFVKKDSPVQSVADLKGLKVAWVDKTSTAGYLFPQAMLRKEHLNPSKFFAQQTFADSHKGVCEAVLSGAADVGATFHTGAEAGNLKPDGCLVSLGSKVADQVRGIAVSDPIPNEVIAARATLPKGLALKLAGVFANLSESEEGQHLLKVVFHADDFGAVLESDFDGVRAALEMLPKEKPVAEAAVVEEKPYIIGLEPTLSESISLTEGRILARYLSTELKHPVESRAFTSYDELIEAVTKNEVDFAWLNPYAFVKASQQSHVTPLVKANRQGQAYRSVFFVRAESPARKLADLKGLKVAWVDKTSTAGYLFPQALLLKKKLEPSTFFRSETFAGSHKAVCEAVLSGAAEVGATFHTGNDPRDFRPDGCFVSMRTNVTQQIRGIATSDPIPNEVIAGASTLDRKLGQKIAGVFLNMRDSTAGRDVLRVVFHAESFGNTEEKDFEPVRAALEAVEGRPAAPAVAAVEPTVAPAEEAEPETPAPTKRQKKEPKPKPEPKAKPPKEHVKAEPKATPQPKAELKAKPEPKQHTAADKTVLFAHDEARLLLDALPILDEIAAKLKADPKLRIRIDGFTDAQSTPEFNKNLSWRRATIVREYLLKAGVPPVRMWAHGYGMARPVASNDNEQGRTANRRVEISFIAPAANAPPAPKH